MRFVVLLFGLLAIPLTALLGAVFLMVGTALKMAQENFPDVQIPDVSATQATGSLSDTGLFLIIASVYGFIGVILSLMRCGWQGALMLIVPVACTGIMNPMTLGATGLQVFTGLLSFLVFPVPLPPAKPPADKDDADEDEE